MNICQKCANAIRSAGYNWNPIESAWKIEEIIVPESECEFQIHVELRRVFNEHEDQRERAHELGLRFPDDPTML
jgi:hypothetical protein